MKALIHVHSWKYMGTRKSKQSIISTDLIGSVCVKSRTRERKYHLQIYSIYFDIFYISNSIKLIEAKSLFFYII